MTLNHEHHSVICWNFKYLDPCALDLLRRIFRWILVFAVFREQNSGRGNCQSIEFNQAVNADMAVTTEYCQLDTFYASCASDQVVYILSAFYGRMKLGRCVRYDYGYVGCKVDVLAQVDRFCSGKRMCEFPVARLNKNQPCPEDLTPYLDISYHCLPVVTTDRGCAALSPISISAQTGYLASILTSESGIGTSDCPWRIEAMPGQRFDITLVNFARVGLPEEWRRMVGMLCYELAIIRERHVIVRTISECDGAPRISHPYTSISNVVEVDITASRGSDVNFLLHFRAIGCPNPEVAPGVSISRSGDIATMKCRSNEAIWRMQCQDTTWLELDQEIPFNCSSENRTALPLEPIKTGKFISTSAFRYNMFAAVAAGVAFGIFIGGIFLICGFRYIKRQLNVRDWGALTRIYAYRKSTSSDMSVPGCRMVVISRPPDGLGCPSEDDVLIGLCPSLCRRPSVCRCSYPIFDCEPPQTQLDRLSDIVGWDDKLQSLVPV